jgi:hypothetical protein
MDEEELQYSLHEMEMRLFGLHRSFSAGISSSSSLYSDLEFIPVKTGTGVKLMKNGPRHIMDAEDYEPLYVP